MTRDEIKALVPFLPARDAGWTEDQACAFLIRQNARARVASARLLDKRTSSVVLPRTPEGLMLLIDAMLLHPGLSKAWVTNPERRAIRFWHRVVRARDAGRVST